MKTVEYKIIVNTPSTHLSLHAASPHGSLDEKMKRPTTEEADTIAGFDTDYLGIMLHNEDNDNDLIALKMEYKKAGMPDKLR